MKLSFYTTAVGLLAMATHTSALPTPEQDAYGMIAAAATVRVMPFGASIVESVSHHLSSPSYDLTNPQGCWRAYVQKALKEANTLNFNMVGSHQSPTKCTLAGQVVDFDQDNEGHGGARVQEYVAHGNLTGWLRSANPQIIMMHVGTNDIKASRNTTQITDDYSTLLGQMRAQNANMQLLIMKLIPLRSGDNTPAQVAEVPKLNDAIAKWAVKNTQKNSPITVVDTYTGFDAKTMTTDGTHPNEDGNLFMSKRLLKPLQDAIKVRG
jgi:acyl-CoA thioesterase-1